MKPVPILFDHDPKQIIGHMYAEQDHLRLKFSDSVQITTEELFKALNAGIVVKKYRDGKFIEEVEIWELSL